MSSNENCQCIRCRSQENLVVINGIHSICSACYKLLKMGNSEQIIFGSFIATRNRFDEEIKLWREKRRRESEEWSKAREAMKSTKGKTHEKAGVIS